MAEAAVVGHLVFVGMMGSGKTTVGRRVAGRLGRPFFDADDELEAVTGTSIAQWFEHGDVEGFRDAEARVLADLLARSEPAVIATGGGAVVREDTRARLRSPEVSVVWLRASPAFLAHRVLQKANKGNRPLLVDDALGTLEKLYGERRELYGEVADLIVDIEPVHRVEGKPKKKLATLVIDALAIDDSGGAPT